MLEMFLVLTKSMTVQRRMREVGFKVYAKYAHRGG